MSHFRFRVVLNPMDEWDGVEVVYVDVPDYVDPDHMLEFLRDGSLPFWYDSVEREIRSIVLEKKITKWVQE